MFNMKSTGKNPANPNNDILIENAASDGISSICFSPTIGNNILASVSWDHSLRLYQVAEPQYASTGGFGGNSTTPTTVQTQGMCESKIEQPILNVSWKNDGSMLLTGGCDKAGYLWSMANGGLSKQQIAVHDGPINFIKHVPDLSPDAVVTTSFDKTIKYWDCKQSTPALALPTLADKVVALDVKGQMLVAALMDNDHNVYTFDVRKPDTPVAVIPSVLKMQTTAVAIFNKMDGYVLGCIGGRCCAAYLDKSRDKDNFSFKCHRSASANSKEPTRAYPVTSIKIHPEHGTCSTAGSDGSFTFWDMDKRNRLKGFEICNDSISSSCFNASGTLFAYAVSYDWHKGHEFYNKANPNNILIHIIPKDECKPGSK